MLTMHKVSGYENLLKFLSELKVVPSEQINIYFTGSKDSSGHSWCPDCVEAQPIVDEALKKVTTPSHFVYVDVGDRAFWKDTKNPFRTDKDIHISVIPSLIRWKQPERLEGEQLCNPDLLDMFFNDE